MKIALIHFRLLHQGGLETRLFNYIHWFASQGHEVTLFVSRLAEGIEKELPPAAKLTVIPLRHWPRQLRQWVFERKLRKLILPGQFDFSLSLGRTSSQTAVLSPGNHLGFLRATKKKFRGLSDRIQIHLDRRAYRESKFILAASQMMRQEVIELYGIAPEKVHVLYPPARTLLFNQQLKPQREALRRQYGFTPGKTSFLLVSTGHYLKGLSLLLKVFERLQQAPFELIIAGSPAGPVSLSNVRSLGFIRQTQELYAAADCTILPSVYEAYGQVVAESLLCGTPVLISSQVGAKEIVTPREGVVLDTFSIEEWEKTIRNWPARSFQISPSLAQERGLTLDQHMERMLQICLPGK